MIWSVKLGLGSLADFGVGTLFHVSPRLPIQSELHTIILRSSRVTTTSRVSKSTWYGLKQGAAQLCLVSHKYFSPRQVGSSCLGSLAATLHLGQTTQMWPAHSMWVACTIWLTLAWPMHVTEILRCCCGEGRPWGSWRKDGKQNIIQYNKQTFSQGVYLLRLTLQGSYSLTWLSR